MSWSRRSGREEKQKRRPKIEIMERIDVWWRKKERKKKEKKLMDEKKRNKEKIK